MALTSFFFTFFKVFLNGFPDILVASTPRLLERVRGWQAFFLIFFEVFLSGRNRKFTSIDTDFFARESRQLTRITFKIRFNDLTIHAGEAIRVDSCDSRPPSAVSKVVSIPVDRSPRRMKSELALQFPPQPIDETILLDRSSICGGQRFCFVHLAV